MERFKNRHDAGTKLAEALRLYRDVPGGLVLALPLGGIVLAKEVARALRLELDVCMVSKLGMPWHADLAVGALAKEEVVVLRNEVLEDLRVPRIWVDREIALERAALSQREKLYRNGLEPLCVEHRTVILVDEGMALGSKMEAAIASMRRMGAAKVVVGVGVATESTLERLAQKADLAVSVLKPREMGTVAEWYEEFADLADGEVPALLGHEARVSK